MADSISHIQPTGSTSESDYHWLYATSGQSSHCRDGGRYRGHSRQTSILACDGYDVSDSNKNALVLVNFGSVSGSRMRSAATPGVIRTPKGPENAIFSVRNSCQGF
jgi:hypothetical protein